MKHVVVNERVLTNGYPILRGAAVGSGCVSSDVTDSFEDAAGKILVVPHLDTQTTLSKLRSCGAVGIVTEYGGRLSHAAILASHAGIPAVVGVGRVANSLSKGATIECTYHNNVGWVYAGKADIERKEIDLDKLPAPRTKVMLSITSATEACECRDLLCDGIGLIRLEFMWPGLTNGVHPASMLVEERKPALAALVQNLKSMVSNFPNKPISIRLSDFKTDEYRDLVGGESVEPKEDNPMLGWRGAVRYFDEGAFKKLINSEIEAIQSLDTPVTCLVPFVRAPKEVQYVDYALRGDNCGMMIEVPAVAMNIEEYAKHVHTCLFGLSDLRQLLYGVDRNAGEWAGLLNWSDKPLEKLVKETTSTLRKFSINTGLCANDLAALRIAVQSKVDYVVVTPAQAHVARLKLLEIERGDREYAVSRI